MREERDECGGPAHDSEMRILTDADNSVLAGAVDLHVHGYPDIGLDARRRVDDRTMVDLARRSGMAGFVLKSHFWPTMDRALVLQEDLGETDFRVFSSITLNPVLTAGLRPETVEAAAVHGAKTVFFPTWGSASDVAHRGFVRSELIDRILPSIGRYVDDPAHPLTVLGADGRLLPAVRDILQVAVERDLVISTGHLSATEALAMAEAAAEMSFPRLIFAHPLSASIGADVAAITEVTQAGALVEITAIHSVLPRNPVPVGRMFDVIQEIGAENIIISSDSYFDWMPPHVEMLRMFTGQLRMLGLGTDELRTMLVTNPARLVGLA